MVLKAVKVVVVITCLVVVLNVDLVVVVADTCLFVVLEVVLVIDLVVVLEVD